MTDEADPPQRDRLAAITLADALTALGTVQAPVIFGEAATLIGLVDGVVHITVEVCKPAPATPGTMPAAARVPVAHLRLTAAAFIALRDQFNRTNPPAAIGPVELPPGARFDA